MATKKTVKKPTSKTTAKPIKKASEKVVKASNLSTKNIDSASKLKQPEIESVSNNIVKELNVPMDANLKRKLVGVISAVIAVSLFAGFSLYTIPNQILTQTIDKQTAKKQKEEQDSKQVEKDGIQARLDLEAGALKFDQNKSWDMLMNIANFGDLKINLKSEYAPKTVENFVRLAYRDYFNNTIFHRIVNQPTFGVIQGGDADKRNGQGGKSAFYINEADNQNIPDELWLVEPKFETVGEQNVLTNKPEFRYPALYQNFNSDTGTVQYKKGLILMAKTSEANSASSQFFITTKDTVLPAQYTVFGTIDSSNFSVLDKINSEVKPVTTAKDGTQQAADDGKPDKELLLTKLQITSPKL